MLTGRCSPDSASRIEPADEIVDEAEAPRLRAVAEHGQRLLLERLADERRDRAAVVRPHARPVGVEDAHDRRVDPLLAVIGHRQRLGVALRLVVDAARPDRVDVAPVGLRLRVHLRVAVHLARRREQEARALHLREAERVVRAVRADLERLQRQPQVVDRARRAREVVDEVDRLVDLDVLRQVVRHGRRTPSPRRCSMLASEPVSRLSTQMTRWSRASSASQRCEPRNPAPPVTTEVGIGVMLPGSGDRSGDAYRTRTWRTRCLRRRNRVGERHSAGCLEHEHKRQRDVQEAGVERGHVVEAVDDRR